MTAAVTIFPGERRDPKPEDRLRRAFHGTGDFEAYHKAVDFMRGAGFSVGILDHKHPTGLVYGEQHVKKWPRLDPEEQNDLHGQILPAVRGASLRGGTVYVVIRRDASEAVIAAFLEAVAADEQRVEQFPVIPRPYVTVIDDAHEFPGDCAIPPHVFADDKSPPDLDEADARAKAHVERVDPTEGGQP